jgi:hypothetical protein
LAVRTTRTNRDVGANSVGANSVGANSRSPLLIVCLMVLLSGCEGSAIGSSIEKAIAPKTIQTNPSPQNSPSISITPTATVKPEPTPEPNITASPSPDVAILPSPNPSLPVPDFTGQFGDLDAVPEALRPLIQDLNKLAVLNPKQTNLFEPNTSITRREYARWLVVANNRIYKNRPARQIRTGQSASDNPTFTDVPRNDPDFASIQGLANAGLIAQPANKLFRPDANLSREDMVLWKMPIDLRSALPVGSVDAVKQAWGFQDSDRISPAALRAVLADAQAGDLSNIRRSFGYTTLFQPQKFVTRAEAAAALWYFGTATDGLSAQSALEIEQAAINQSTTASPTPQASPTNSAKPTSSLQ